MRVTICVFDLGFISPYQKSVALIFQVGVSDLVAIYLLTHKQVIVFNSAPANYFTFQIKNVSIS